MPFLLAVAVACACLPAIGRADSAVDGCPCLGACARTIDIPTSPWCFTSPVPTDDTPNNTALYCGSYDPDRVAYRDYCVVNTTGAATVRTIDNLPELWATMTVSTTLAVAAAYGIAACAASILISTKRTIWWLPISAIGMGAAQGFSVGAVFAVIVSFLFMAIPYAVEWSTVVALGIGLACLIVYSGMGRHYSVVVAPAAAEYAD